MGRKANRRIIPLHGKGTPTTLNEGEIGVTTNSGNESIWTKNSDREIVKINLSHYVIISKEDYDSLTDKDDTCIYFIIGGTQTVTIKFKDYDGTLLSSKEYEYGNNVVEPQHPTREGYKFVGWDSEITKALEDKTYTAKYEILPYIKITMADSYDEQSLIPLLFEKEGVDEDVVWSIDINNETVIIDGPNLHFLKPYNGNVVVTATAGDYEDNKTINVKCSSVQTPLTVTLDHILSIYPSMKTLSDEIVSDSDNQIAILGRMGRYNDQTWQIAGGVINEEVAAVLNENYPYFTKIQVITLPNGDTLDAPHFWAVINTMFKGTGDLGGWAGDLVEFAATVKTDPSSEFPGTGFDYEDWCSDADAYNIYKNYSSDIYIGLSTYLTDSLTNSERIVGFKTSEDIYTRYTHSPNAMLLRVLAMKYGVSNDNIQLAANKMQEYLDNNS